MREVALQAMVPATLLARRAFYALGRKSVWTNNYKSCKTVKAYQTGSLARDVDIALSVIKTLTDLGYKGVKYDFTHGDGGWTKGAIIIRIPK